MTVAARLRPFRNVGLAGFVVRRLAQAIPLLFAIIALNFALIKLAPGDPVSVLVPDGASIAYRERIQHELGLDRPVSLQFVSYMNDFAHLDLGYSLEYRSPVLPLIWSRIPATLLLSGTGFAISIIAGILLGVVAAQHPKSIFDRMLTLASLTGYSIPAFALAQLLLLIFVLDLGIFPSQGMVSVRNQSVGVAHVLDVMQHLALPALTYGVYSVTLIFRLTRARMHETLAADFIVTARAKGLSPRRVAYRHALPHVLLPVISVIGYNFGYLLAGAILIETVFSWPGIGLLLRDAVAVRDYPLLLGLFAVTATMVIIANFVTDVLYAAIDPRVTKR